MTKSFAIRPRVKNNKRGFQIVYMYLGNYFHKNGYEADEYEVEDGWYENREDAECEAMNLQFVLTDEEVQKYKDVLKKEK